MENIVDVQNVRDNLTTIRKINIYNRETYPDNLRKNYLII